MFASLTAKVVTAICALVGAIALLGTFLLTLTGGSPLSAVRSGAHLLSYVLGGLLLVDGVRAGPRPVGAKCADLVELVEGERRFLACRGSWMRWC